MVCYWHATDRAWCTVVKENGILNIILHHMSEYHNKEDQWILVNALVCKELKGRSSINYVLHFIHELDHSRTKTGRWMLFLLIWYYTPAGERGMLDMHCKCRVTAAMRENVQWMVTSVSLRSGLSSKWKRGLNFVLQIHWSMLSNTEGFAQILLTCHHRYWMNELTNGCYGGNERNIQGEISKLVEKSM